MPLWQVIAVIALVGPKVVEAGPCPPEATPDTEYKMCYHMPPIPLPWVDSRRMCQLTKGDLIPTVNERILGLLKGTLQSDDRYWTGLNDRNVEGTYSRLYTSDPVDDIPWSGGQKPADNDLNDCVTTDGTNAFVERCSQPNYFICGTPFGGGYEPEADVECPTGFIGKYAGIIIKKCFMKYNERKTWEEARVACEALHPESRLVNVHSFQFQDRLVQYMTSGWTYWTGFNDRHNESQFRWLDNTEPLSYLSWAEGEPTSTTDADEDCVSLERSAETNLMSDTKCDTKMGYICQLGPEIDSVTTSTTTTTTTPSTTTHPGYRCGSEDWTLFEEGGECFKLVDEKPKMWQAARIDCITQGGDLAKIPDSDTHEFIKAEVMGDGRVWISLKDTDKDGKFKWLGETEETSYSAWRSPPRNLAGNEHCVELIGKHEGKWNDKVCNAKRGYICQKQATLNGSPGTGGPFEELAGL